MSTHFAVGTLTGAITPKKLTPYPVLRGELVSATSHFVPVLVKLLPSNLRMVEVACGWMAREVGLPFPLPAHIRVRKSRIERVCPWPYGPALETMCFGTQEILQAQPLKAIDTTESGQLEQLLKGWKDSLRVGVFDELIANDDRNNGNLLIDPYRNLWIIDHSRALRAGGQTPFSDPFLSFENSLLQRFAQLPIGHRNALYPTVIADCAQMSSIVDRIPYTELGIDGQVRADIERFLEQRARRLRALVLSRLGISELPFHEQHPPTLSH